MTNYTWLITPDTITKSVQERKAARKKIIEAARQLERKSYLAMIRRKRLARGQRNILHFSQWTQGLFRSTSTPAVFSPRTTR